MICLMNFNVINIIIVLCYIKKDRQFYDSDYENIKTKTCFDAR